MPARRNFVRRQECAAKLRADAKLQKVVAGDELAHHLPRSAAASDVHGGENGPYQAVERPVVVAKVLVVRIREPVAAPGWHLVEDDAEP